MKKVAVYPGTFDPITFGHIDVIKKALKLFDKVIVAASDGANKNYLFNPNERIEIIKKALFSDFCFKTSVIIELEAMHMAHPSPLKLISSMVVLSLSFINT